MLGRVVHDSGATAVEQGLVVALIALVIICQRERLGCIGELCTDAGLLDPCAVKGCSTVK